MYESGTRGNEEIGTKRRLKWMIQIEKKQCKQLAACDG